MRPLIFVDLDDTLFQTDGKCPPGERVCVAHDKAGQPLSYMSEYQCRFVEFLMSAGDVVPTTGRNVDAFRRVTLPFSGHAICSHGGLILTPEGAPEPRWREIVETESAAAAATLEELEALARSKALGLSIDARCRIIGDDGLPLYVSIKHNREKRTELAELAESLRASLPEGWVLHLNGNNMAFLPPFASKRRAVAWYMENIAPPASFTIGLGDSASDAEFMSLCHYALTPSSSQLFARLMEVCV